jgi:hypothetical protein
MTSLSSWENFYVIVGSSAGALIGLQFVAIALIADMPIGPGAAQAGDAFGTPTIVHFSMVLLLAAVLSAPWQGIAAPAAVCGLLGIGGVVYEFIVMRRMRTQTVYKPEFEDWLFHVLLPIAAYAALAASACVAFTHVSAALFGVAATSLLLLFIGIHNAWDAVTYHVFVVRKRHQQKAEPRT